MFTFFDVVAPDLLVVTNDQREILTQRNVGGAPASGSTGWWTLPAIASRSTALKSLGGFECPLHLFAQPDCFFPELNQKGRARATAGLCLRDGAWGQHHQPFVTEGTRVVLEQGGITRAPNAADDPARHAVLQRPQGGSNRDNFLPRPQRPGTAAGGRVTVQ